MVAAAKYFISLDSFHGREPFLPIPRDESCATIRVAFSEEDVGEDVDIFNIQGWAASRPGFRDFVEKRQGESYRLIQRRLRRGKSTT